jgi:selenocysteine lyase/cysteine desulfurase
MNGTQTTRRSFLRTLAAAGAASPLLARAEGLEAALVSTDASAPFDGGSAAAVRRLRGQYLLSDDLIYLNHASIGTVPEPVHRAHEGYLELCESYPSLYVWGAVWREVTETTRSAAASLLGCAPDDLAITHNTTEGVNILAHGLPLGAGDEVLFRSLNHAGAAVPWDVLQGRGGYSVRRFDFPVARAPELTVDEVVALHTQAIRPETRVLVIPHVDNIIGMNHPVRAIADAARERGVEFVLVDGAQSAGMLAVDLGAMGVDAYSMSPHKWMQAPKGLGLFWVSPELQQMLPRMWHKTGGTRVDATARKYEDYSTRAWPAVVALGDALDFQASIGEAEKGRRYRALWERVHDRTTADERLVWRSTLAPELRSVIMAVEVRGAAAPEVARTLLDRAGVDLRAFGGDVNTLRVSPNVLTTDEKLDRFLDAASEEAM